MRMTRLVVVPALACAVIACRPVSTVRPTNTSIDPCEIHPRALGTASGAVVLTDEALRLHRSAVVVDGHNDLPWKIREKAESSSAAFDLSRPQPDLHTDIPRLLKGGVGAQFWVAWVPPKTIKEGGGARIALEQIDLIHRMVRRYPDVFEMALTADDIERISREGRVASLIGLEGGHAIENSLGALRAYFSLGVRYMTLTHSDTHDWADSATDEARHGGLTPFGESVVLEMNRLGMLVDISHVSADAMRDVLAVSRAPVIASHSSAYAIAPHPRNVPDDVLRLIAENGGVVMVNFFSGFLHPEAARVMEEMFTEYRRLDAEGLEKEALRGAMKQWREAHPAPSGTVGTLVDHIDHILDVAGIDHVGLGSDYDGISVTPKQLEDVSCFPYITQGLLNRGYSKRDIRKILGGNFLRAFREAERVAARLQLGS